MFLPVIAPSPSAMRKLLAICDWYASDYDIIFNADKSKFIVFVSPNRRFLVKAMNSCVFRSTSKSLPNNIRRGKNVRPYVRTSVRPSVHKKFLRFQ